MCSVETDEMITNLICILSIMGWRKSWQLTWLLWFRSLTDGQEGNIGFWRTEGVLVTKGDHTGQQGESNTYEGRQGDKMETFDPSSVECYYHIWYICPCNKWCHLTSILQILRKAKPRKKRTTMYPIVVSTLKFHKDDDVDPADAGCACWRWTTKRWIE